MEATSVTVYVVSDSAGDTGELAVRAAAAQFHPLKVQIRRAGFIQREAAIDAVLEAAQSESAVVLYTLVIDALRAYMASESARRGISAIDLLGPLIDQMEQRFGCQSRHEPGLNHVLDAGYFRKVEAVEFAVRYDDARDVTGVSKADIVLTGVSRTSKTPLSMVLAHRTYKVANVPLVPELTPPRELFLVPKTKIFGLTIRPDALNAIRVERLKALGLPNTASYATAERIQQELEYAHGIMKKLGCVIIDVSNKAVEETASLIMERLEK
ncbi:kinase/pyrophosphorylase [Cohnella ginsengisoli]|uniref:Putative pyruvate, phosphate dikinase regulatory protein n=1 Tax=Cohnella ginsengisoli TaxID=425004 RepID=A0A9X4KNE7_9BACL|nr:pyruvate, water dikinase regulatory protein [Cohnella ginsengisoli]MDG0793232.1 kinase/pyrophosphorylase [Cohnella ginsengisoli]